MKLSTKLLLSFGFVTLLLLSLGLASKYLNDRARQQLVVESRSAVQELELASEIGIELYRSMANIQYFLEERYRRSLSGQAGEDTVTLDRSRLNIRESLESIRSKLANYRSAAGSPGERADSAAAASLQTLRTISDKMTIYTSLVEQLMELTSDSYEDGKEFFTVTIEPYFRSNLLPLIVELRAQTKNSMDRRISGLNARLDASSQWLLYGTVAALLAAMGLAWMLYRSIASPVARLAEAAREVGRGNLDRRIEVGSSDEIGQLGHTFNRMAENLSRTTVSRNYMDDIIESMGDALVVADRSGTIQRVNGAALKMLGYQSEGELSGRDIGILLPEGDDGGELFKPEEGCTFEAYETRFRRTDGGTLPVSVSKGFMHDADGKIQGMVCVAGDITERKKAKDQIARSLREKEVLLAEIHHRVKNNLAVISGLLQMQMWETESHSARQVLIDSQLRVQSIALVHEKLYQSDSLSHVAFDTYARELVEAIGQTYMNGEREIELRTDLEPLEMSINQAIPCALLLNELTVNSYKHAFGDRPKGKIEVKVYREEDDIVVVVRDDGRGLPEDFSLDQAQSLGMSLMDTLVQQLRGELDVFNDGGAVFRVHFPADEVPEEE
ncbi:MAG: histidine kinase dimerization/phosphoacceptor domain -containing protein [Balneolaceae bacterium]|nr:histidine kinase dimerization/phosphoacceptor domain -containing protein [Balneolaceae bacterium]